MDRSYHIDRSSPKAGQIFVFGSNLAGRHGAGAAKAARVSFGAKYGQGDGLQGQSYGIPTKDKKLKTLSLTEIEDHVKVFVLFAIYNPDLSFFITRVGCGLAGLKDNQVAPMFKYSPQNCSFAKQWEPYL